MTPRSRAPERERTILHVDMDAFYVSVEIRRDPSLRGRPVIVGGDGRRGVVAAASYEARAHGVHSAMPSLRARRLCPQALFLPGDHALYAGVSRRVMDVFRDYTPLVEPLSLDEAFLDVTGAGRLHGDGAAIGADIRERVLEQEGCSCSVGVSAVKFVAKLASVAAKPRATPRGPEPGSGVEVVAPGEELAFLHPLPIRVLWGVGPATRSRLDGLGVRTIGDLAALPEALLIRHVGDAVGRHLHRLSNGVDDRDVVVDAAPKSIGHEETFSRDRYGHEALAREAVRLSDSVAARARAQHLLGRTVSVKLRYSADFRTVTRSVTLDRPVSTGTEIAREAKALLGRLDPSPGVRLLGVALTGLTRDAPEQLRLEADDHEAWSEVAGAMDRVRARFGRDAVVPATLAGPSGIHVADPGSRPWGPGDEPQDP